MRHFPAAALFLSTLCLACKEATAPAPDLPCVDVSGPSLPVAPSLWTLISPSGSTPPTRWEQATAYDVVNDRMIVFGGRSSSGYLNDVWVLTNANGVAGGASWTQLQPTGTAPSPRFAHMAGYDPVTNRLVVFGGVDATRYYNDVWVLTNANGVGGTPVWTQLTVPNPPPLRGWSSAAYDAGHNRLIVFGGESCNDPTCTPTNDVWVLTNANGTGGTPAFTRLTTSGTAPSARHNATAVYDAKSDRLIVFGGSSSTSFNFDAPAGLNDAFVLSGPDPSGARVWTRLNPSTLPPARQAHAAVFDDVRSRLIVFGGVGTDNFLRRDVWQLELLSGSTTGTWTAYSAGTPSATGRAWLSAAYSSTLDRLALFGGYGGTNNLLNDVWSLRATGPAVKNVTVSARDSSVCVGNRIQLGASAADATGSAVNRTFTWTSNNPSVLAVDDAGLGTGVAEGTTTVQACADGICSTISVTVRAGKVVPTPGPVGKSLRVATQFVSQVEGCVDANGNKTTNFSAVTLMAEGGAPLSGYTWSLTPGFTFPAGITVDPLTGIVHRTSPTSSMSIGTSSLRVTVSDGSTSAPGIISVIVASATSAVGSDGFPGVGCPAEVFEQAGTTLVTLIGGVTGRGYGASLFAAPGADGQPAVNKTLTWSLATGQLPPGLTIDAARGVVRGTPTTAGTYNFTIKVTNSAGQVATSPAGGTPPTYRIVVTSS